jgi:hypothetical protein
MNPTSLLPRLLLLSSASFPWTWPWLPTVEPARSLEARVPLPPGCTRVPLAEASFGAWLRHLPLKEGQPQVLLHDGRPKARQDVHVAVVDIDVGKRDLQQCADAAIRLRAEWLWSMGRADEAAFRFTSGHLASFTDWRRGLRPIVEGSSVRFEKRAAPDASHESFRRYLDKVFEYAGTLSLARDLPLVEEAPCGGLCPPHDLRPGDVIVEGASPGHAVVVADLASCTDGEWRFLLLQSYMPAQEIHLLREPADPDGGPWYRASAFGDPFVTAEWTFHGRTLRRWP